MLHLVMVFLESEISISRFLVIICNEISAVDLRLSCQTVPCLQEAVALRTCDILVVYHLQQLSGNSG